MYGPMKTAFERYDNDPAFKLLVDILQHEIEAARYTPSELRMAVILAATLVDYRTARPLIYGYDAEIRFYAEEAERQNKARDAKEK